MRSAIVVLAFAALLPLPAHAGYAYRASLSIPAASTTDQTNITLLIVGSDARLKTAANGGEIQHTVSRVGQTVPADMVLSSDAAGTSMYKWGWDYYDPVNGIVKIWFLMPTHSHSGSTTVYISIGNSAVTTYQGGAQGAEFDSNTKGVWHLSDGTTLNLKDSSSGSNDAVNSGGTAATGKTDGGMSLSGSSVATVAWPFTTDITTSLQAGTGTFCAWANSTDVTNERGIMGVGNSGGQGLNLMLYSGNVNFWYSDGALVHGTSTLSTNTWYYLCGVASSLSNLTLYVNGVADGSGSSGLGYAIIAPVGSVFLLGNEGQNGSSRSFHGKLDEMRVSTVPRSANWIATEYANQSSPPSIGAFAPVVVIRGTLLGFSQ